MNGDPCVSGAVQRRKASFGAFGGPPPKEDGDDSSYVKGEFHERRYHLIVCRDVDAQDEADGDGEAAVAVRAFDQAEASESDGDAEEAEILGW